MQASNSKHIYGSNGTILQCYDRDPTPMIEVNVVPYIL